MATLPFLLQFKLGCLLRTLLPLAVLFSRAHQAQGRVRELLTPHGHFRPLFLPPPEKPPGLLKLLPQLVLSTTLPHYSHL